MPGAYTHLTLVNEALINPVQASDLSVSSRRILTTYQPYVEFGAIAPDLPYLVYGDNLQAKWADRLHREQVGAVLKTFIDHLRHDQCDHQSRGKRYAWLSGYLTHVIADVIIHPVIERLIGRYDENKAQHRICEMHQDTYIWQRMHLGEIGHVERLSQTLRRCTAFSRPIRMDQTIESLWSETLHHHFPGDIVPDFDRWFRSVIKVIDWVEDQYRLFPFSRHVAAFLGLVYPHRTEIDTQYILKLDSPVGPMDFATLFSITVGYLVDYQKKLEQSVFHGAAVDWIQNWNLDTGRNEAGALAIWPDQNKRRQMYFLRV